MKEELKEIEAQREGLKPVITIDENGQYPIIRAENELFPACYTVFEIDNKDISGKYNWKRAIQQENDGWRLPNLHELFIMRIVCQNISNPLFTHLTGLYWCNTGNHFRAYRIYFASAGYYIGKYCKFKTCNVRLIRSVI